MKKLRVISRASSQRSNDTQFGIRSHGPTDSNRAQCVELEQAFRDRTQDAYGLVLSATLSAVFAVFVADLFTTFLVPLSTFLPVFSVASFVECPATFTSCLTLLVVIMSLGKSDCGQNGAGDSGSRFHANLVQAPG